MPPCSELDKTKSIPLTFSRWYRLPKIESPRFISFHCRNELTKGGITLFIFSMVLVVEGAVTTGVERDMMRLRVLDRFFGLISSPDWLNEINAAGLKRYSLILWKRSTVSFYWCRRRLFKWWKNEIAGFIAGTTNTEREMLLSKLNCFCFPASCTQTIIKNSLF